MTHVRRSLVAIVLPVLVAGGMVTTALASGPAPKVEVCHFASHKYVEISISTNALQAHLNHGDVMPDAYGACP